MNNLSRVKNRQIRPMPTRAKDRGFTLIEVLVVTGVIGILLGIAVPAYNEYREQAKIAEVKQVLKDIERAMMALGHDTGKWPGPVDWGEGSGTEIENLNSPEAGLKNNDDNDFSNWNGPYIEPSVPLDPWGNNYFFDPDYEIPKNGPKFPVIGSYGPNGTGKNNYDSDDVIMRLACKKSDCS